MFSDVAHRQQNHNLPQPLYACDLNGFKDTSSLPHVDSQPRHCNQFQHGSFRQRLEKPQQCIRPLQNPISMSQQGPLRKPYTPAFEASEHMLRRKTPNGTLAAGYDGSNVEWTGRSHAMKHLLVTTTNDTSQAVKDELAEQSPSMQAQSMISGLGKLNRPQQFKSNISLSGVHQFSRSTDNAKANVEWRSHKIPAAGLDSMLNQSASHHHHYNLAGSQHVPTVLQPMWPPSLGPTSIHSPGLYGPDGVFEPCRPASLRGPSFQQQAAETNVGLSMQVQPAVNNYGQWPKAHSDLECPQVTKQSNTSGVAFEHLGASNYGFDSTNYTTTKLNNPIPEPPHQQPGVPLAFRRKPSSCSYQNDRTFDDIYMGSGLPNSGVSGFPLALLDDQTPPNGNLRFKERVLMWAHRVYGSLLASIEQARRKSPSEQCLARSSQFSELHPHPPPRPYPSWSNSHRRDNQTYIFPNKPMYSPSRDTGTATIQLMMSDCHGKPSSCTQIVVSQSMSIPSPPSGQSRQRLQLRDGALRSYLFASHSSYVPPHFSADLHASSPLAAAVYAMEMLGRLCQESGLEWIDGMLLSGCLAYGLGDFNQAMNWYSKVLERDPNNVEATSNLAATLLALNRRDDAEQYWFRSVKLRPSYFEAIEHLIGLLHETQRGKEAVNVIEYVEHALRTNKSLAAPQQQRELAVDDELPMGNCLSGSSGLKAIGEVGLSGYAIAPSDNGRMLALIHGKGNMLYQSGDNAGAAKAFEDAILIGAGRRHLGIRGLIRQILVVFAKQLGLGVANSHGYCDADEPILLSPDMALETSRLVFPAQGRLPGLEEVPGGFAHKAAVSIISNSLLSLAKIYQDGMSSSGAAATAPRAASGVQEILALYYLSLSLQPSPSTANNVGILLAGVQQSARSKSIGKPSISQASSIPGVIPGSGIALALAYYDYGLKLDSHHAHLYTNLGSLFKDIGQLGAAIKMYEKAVECDGNFDIALANLANAVKDQGKVSDAIIYYKRAVASNPDFAEAVCGLANALNSVCSWSGRGGINHVMSNRDRWHVDERGGLRDSKKSPIPSSGWIERVVAIVDKQLRDGEGWGKGVLHSTGTEEFIRQLSPADISQDGERRVRISLSNALEGWAGNRWEGAKVVRLIERATKRLVHQIYRSRYIHREPVPSTYRVRPQLPAALAIPSAPTVLPFHTFTCPVSAKQIRRISQRNGLRVSCTTLRAPWLPAHVYDPPAPPAPHLNVGYISSDFNNHPLAHLMQSVFGLHNKDRVKAFCYATTASDKSVHRQQIEREAPVFLDASSWSIDRLVNQILADGIHILINLNGYTRGAKNEVFAARPAPVQMSFMGFAGTLGAEWCDYLLADKIAVPPQTLRPWRGNVNLTDQTMDGNNDDEQDDWVYGENIIFTKDTFFCCDHRQSAPDSQEVQLSWPEEQCRRWRMRNELFPDLPEDTVIFGNFNQLYKVCYPFVF